MDSGEDQNNTGTTNGNPQTSGNSRTTQIAHMSLYERQAVQALQALQRQPNAAQYFQQLMLQQQISSAQLHNLAAVQQATLAASRQSNTPSNSMSQAATTVNLSTTSAGGTMTNPRPHGPATSAATTALNQSVLLGGNSPGQGQMYLRVNRSLRAPLASQFIFMPGGTATATVATVAQTQPPQQQQQQQQHEVAPTNASTQSDNDQVQNLALHHASTTRTVAVKSELPERKDATSFPISQQQQQQQQTFSQTAQQQVQPQQQQQMAKPFTQQSTANMSVKTGNQATMAVTPAVSVAPSSTSSTALPLSQLLLSPSAAPVILVPTSNVPTSTQGYPIGSVTPKANVNTQTLVVQPLQQASATTDKGPVPIQPKTAQGHRLPVQLPPRHPPPILPAPPSSSQAAAGGHNPPHIPVQLVGARQNVAGSAQAVALAQTRVHEHTSGNIGTTSNNGNMTKPAVGSLKRKSDCDASNEMASESVDSVPIKDSAPPLSPAPTKDSAPPAAAAFSSPPTLSLPLPLSRVGHGDKDRAPVPQAVVKPQVLTHLIEGFVIQEGAEPFPVAGLLKDRDFALVGRSENGPPLLKCEYCGSLAPASQFRGTKRFCSNTCAKRYNVSCSQHFKTSRGRSGAGLASPPGPTESTVRRRGTPRRSSSEISCNKIPSRHLPVKCHSESSRSEDASSDGEEDDSPSLSPSSSHSCSRADHSAPPSDSSAPGSLPLEVGNFLSSTPAQWSVEEVCRFISSLQGCEELAAQFLSQEIDGQALLLLREDHLISTMNIKLGPALKICASINSLRE
ncbi:polyhomeotic-like protein 1 [Sphaeramia orbicularis]|uniref:polyhomeotic-like protein 1 n=1 Tax=Sphaeramia orbicularis TaxID=375764 RepID=UPI00117F9354|nr:polyhomeotic-like protein 1 [Sphaeramia orbicularis]XP_030013761.1 polyhomeotic-like protein 1 [Sphaeramia orbicularis]XP_030013762.1 polyhomeotic-like protein 1 [Sphaeramia orbicularis]